MSQIFNINPRNPQRRMLAQAVAILRAGGVIALTTDASYVLACALGQKAAIDRVRQIRQLDKEHHFTLMCRDLSEIATYAKVDNQAFRLLKRYTPGAYTFLLKATKQVPSRLYHPKRKVIGIRIPDCVICLDLLDVMSEPLLTTSLRPPTEALPHVDPEQIQADYAKDIELVIAGQAQHLDGTSVVSLLQGHPVVIRQGLGDTSEFVE